MEFQIKRTLVAVGKLIHQSSRRKKFFMKLLLILGLLWPNISKANLTCSGRFVNPITDICWSCVMPISIGKFKPARGSGIKNRDIKSISLNKLGLLIIEIENWTNFKSNWIKNNYGYYILNIAKDNFNNVSGLEITKYNQ